ncbi:DUF2637 domain-containing protein, partial [Streptomyces sp. NPDC054975]
ERERLEREAEQRREAERLKREADARREREAAAERAARERAALLSGGPVDEKLTEDRARDVVQAAFIEGLPVRAAVELCGWSVGWVSTRYQEHREAAAGRMLEGATS